MVIAIVMPYELSENFGHQVRLAASPFFPDAVIFPVLAFSSDRRLGPGATPTGGTDGRHRSAYSVAPDPARPRAPA